MSDELLSHDEIREKLDATEGWSETAASLNHSFKFKNFLQAMKFVNRVAELAEAANHHPDIDIRWNTVRLVLSTHSAGGLTEKDFALAEECFAAAAEIS
jgi:4a-hydroxytetrahydrobiopterin dehydratase